MTAASNVIWLDYQGADIGFTHDGWFDATSAADKHGKRVSDWLENQETKDYIAALAQCLNVPKERDLIRAKRGRNGGTWLHPKLAVSFARWLDIRFAVWCDLQIDFLIRGSHPHYDRLRARDAAASSFKVMGEVLRLARLDGGKDTKAHHYINEARLVNWAASGEFKSLDRESLSVGELALLANLEERNAVLLGRGVAYADRKKMLEQHALDWRAGQRLPEPPPDTEKPLRDSFARQAQARGTTAMPVKSSIKKLPPDLQWDIDRKIIEGDYRSVPELFRWIEEKGFAVSKTTLYRHKRTLEKEARVQKHNGKVVKEAHLVSTAQLEWENFHLTERLAALAKAMAKMAKRKNVVEQELFQRYQAATPPTSIVKHNPALSQTQKPKT